MMTVAKYKTASDQARQIIDDKINSALIAVDNTYGWPKGTSKAIIKSKYYPCQVNKCRNKRSFFLCRKHMNEYRKFLLSLGAERVKGKEK
jgi:hypothetical protein